MAENSLAQLQIQCNASNVGNWEISRPHRERVLQLLIEAKHDQQPSLCALGAGNCHDLDLTELAKHYAQIDLVDLDSAALERGVQQQACQSETAIHLHGDCDITGIWTELSAAKSNTLDDPAIDRLIEKATLFPSLPLSKNYGTVVSTCLLSQLVDAILLSVGQHPRFLEIIQTVRLHHLKLLVELLAPGGTGILVTDFVSSDTVPGLANLPADQLPAILAQLIAKKNFFTGLNPFLLQAIFGEDPHLARLVSASDCQTPWIWNLGPRDYAVTAITFRRIANE